MKRVGKIEGLFAVFLGFSMATSVVFAMEQEGTTSRSDDEMTGIGMGLKDQDAPKGKSSSESSGCVIVHSDGEEVGDPEGGYIPSLEEIKKYEEALMARDEEARNRRNVGAAQRGDDGNESDADINELVSSWTWASPEHKAAFWAWYEQVGASKTYFIIRNVLGVVGALYLLHFIWTGASEYCAVSSVMEGCSNCTTGIFEMANEHVLCPAVWGINWIYEGCASFVTNVIPSLWQSAIDSIQKNGVCEVPKEGVCEIPFDEHGHSAIL